MKRTASIIGLLIFLAMSSGCILSASPDPEKTVTLAPYETKIFLVTATNVFYPGNNSMEFTWYVDGVPQELYNPAYIFWAGPQYIGRQFNIECVVEIKLQPSGIVLWRDSVVWAVNTSGS